MTEVEFDSEVMALVEDLGLVEIGSLEYREFLAALSVSHYTRYWFCERVKDQWKEKERQRVKLQRELARRNRKWSHYVYASFAD